MSGLVKCTKKPFLTSGFYAGLIYVLIIAIFMTIFELLFFIIMVVPLESRVIREKTKYLGLGPGFSSGAVGGMVTGGMNIGGLTIGSMSALESMATEVVVDVLNVAVSREQGNYDHINNTAILIISVEVFIFAVGILLCYSKITESGLLWPIIALSVLTSIILIGFQLVMYVYAGGTGVPGSYKYASDNELKYIVYQKLEKDLKGT
jgi:hypothetical protein